MFKQNLFRLYRGLNQGLLYASLVFYRKTSPTVVSVKSIESVFETAKAEDAHFIRT